jgi:hypothetical protein
VNGRELRSSGRALIDVDEALDPELLPLAERSLRRALEPGGDLEHLALRVGRRVFIRVGPLLELLGLSESDPGTPTAPGLATTTTESGARHARNDNALSVV